MTDTFPHRLQAAYERVRGDLLRERTPAGHWVGELATSALSTAVAVSALALARQAQEGADPSLLPVAVDPDLPWRGLDWLARHQNPDGGWGDTDRSDSNIATTLLVQAAFRLADPASAGTPLLQRAAAYVAAQGGIPGLEARYGRDKTFAVPILTNLALAGMVDWRRISPLPFELAMLPMRWLGALQLPVVSYALPALIAIGQARYLKAPPWNPLLRAARSAALERTLDVLGTIQPESGGYLEAVPLTGFVVMSLVGTGRERHAVVRRGVEFLTKSVRPDGSWPIDTNLATWVTTLSLNALAACGEPIVDDPAWDWVWKCRHTRVHPYTNAAPGGWAWTDLSGGVPDADDTPGALLALAARRDREPTATDPAAQGRRARGDEAAGWGVKWLLDLQNRDGGWPTFCRGWGALPFDRSGTDLTAHAVRALAAWLGKLRPEGLLSPAATARFERFDRRIAAAVRSGFAYLARTQRSDGAWLPLWFGNQDRPNEENPVYGTARVLLAYRDLARMADPAAQAGVRFLLEAQRADGGWGAPRDCPAARGSSIEETALALTALAPWVERPEVAAALRNGAERLVKEVEAGGHSRASPIGFYFAKLWYYEKLYPLIFALHGLGAVRSVLGGGQPVPRERATASAAT